MYPRLKRVFEVVHMKRGLVHTTPEEFKNVALFLRLGLPSTLIRHENEVFRKRLSNQRNLKTETLLLR